MEEVELVRKARLGDMDAFESLVRKYQQKVYALCRRLTGAHQSADDLAQETFIKAYFSLESFDEGRPLYPWLRRIALNAGLNYVKRRGREKPFDDGGPDRGRKELTQAVEGPEQQLERAELEAGFESAVKALPTEQRTVFVLRFYEDMSYDEIARELGLPLGTVMSRLNRARRRLRELLEAPEAKGA
jgi:RNA polymerase sigma-70 factor (ECF subfamily)